MLSRFVAGFLHPFIHVGYGAEFSFIGVSAEGSCLNIDCHYDPWRRICLAMAAVQSSNPDQFPSVWFPDVISSVDNLKEGDRTALLIVAPVSCDPRFSHIKHMDEEMMPSKTLTEHGSIVHNYVNMWKFDISTKAGIAGAIEEPFWANVLNLRHRWILHRQARIQCRFLTDASSDVIHLPSVPVQGRLSASSLLGACYY